VLQVDNQCNESVLVFGMLLKIVSGFLSSCELIDYIARLFENFNLILVVCARMR
jgi:hypothetical protein